MSRVVPSQVVEIINSLFPFTSTQRDGESISLDYSHTESLAGIAHLIDQIPPELIHLKDTDYINFIINVEAIRSAVKSFEQRGNVNPLKFLPGFKRLNPVTIVRRALEKCPDEFPSRSVTELLFISDIKILPLGKYGYTPQAPPTFAPDILVSVSKATNSIKFVGFCASTMTRPSL